MMHPLMSMRACATRFRALLADERGTTAIEYGIIAVGVSIVIIAVVWSIGTEIKTSLYQKVLDLLGTMS